MIVASRPIRFASRFAQGLSLLLAVGLLPLGSAIAQDIDEKTEVYLKQVWDMLQNRVEAGEMSAEEAEAKMASIKKRKLAGRQETAPTGAGKKPPTGGFWDAVVSGKIEAIERHLAAGADVNATDPTKPGPPLMMATVFGQTEAANLLIGKGARVGARNKDGNTALHAAAFLGQVDMVSLLLQNGADINAQNLKGETPLDVVAGDWTDELEGIYRAIGRLLQAELDIDSIREARPGVAELLREKGGRTGGPGGGIWRAATEGDLDGIKQFLAIGGHMNLKGPAGATPLIAAAFFGRTESAELIIDNGAVPELRNNDGNTALHIAAFLGHPETVSLLLERGADMNAKNNRNETPLDVVAGDWTDELEGIYEMLAGVLKVELDLERIRVARPKVAAILRDRGDAR